MDKRTFVYVDGANFYGGLTSINKKFTDTKFDFENYANYLAGKEKLIRINYYNALVKKRINEKIWKKQSDFFNMLRKIPKCKITLCTRKSRLTLLGEEYHTIKGDDISLALDMIEDCYNDKFDKVILISGDGDFSDLLNRVKKRQKEIEVCYFEGCASGDLLRKADKIRLISKKTVNKFFLRENKYPKKIS
ncbi:NYN domain-containing protein [Candidatus Pacearchaeota archaeon]|nr:NYN domain-containing protein [Candidatus Pacearchaeota archaeon]